MSAINQLLELLELYSIPFQQRIGDFHMQVNFSNNPNLTIEFVLSHPMFDWDYTNLSRNPSISTPSNLIKHASFPWVYPMVFGSSAFSEQDILQHYFEKKEIEPIHLIVSYNKNITPHFFKMIKLPWTVYMNYLGHNEHFTELLVNEICKMDKLANGHNMLCKYQLLMNRKLQ